MSEKKLLYFSIAFLNTFLGSSWIMALYNDPGMVKSRDVSEWIVIWSITMLIAAQAGFIALKAYTSDPNPRTPTENETTPPPDGGVKPPGP